MPRGPDRELVRERGRTYAINGAESRMLTTVGAFRVVSRATCTTSSRVLCQDDGQPLTRQMVQYRALRAARRAKEAKART